MRSLPLLWQTIVLRAVLTSVVACITGSVVMFIQAGWPPSDFVAIVYTPLVFILLHHVFR